MFDFFIALFGGTYYAAKGINANLKHKRDVAASNAAYEEKMKRKIVDATISVSENVSEQLRKKIDHSDQQWIYDELEPELIEMFGKNYEDVLPLRTYKRVMSYQFYNKKESSCWRVGTPAYWAKQLIIAKRYHLADPKVCDTGYPNIILYDEEYNNAPTQERLNEYTMKMIEYIFAQISSTGKDIVFKRVKWSPDKYRINRIIFQHDVLNNEITEEVFRNPEKQKTQWEIEKEDERKKEEHATNVRVIIGSIILVLFVITTLINIIIIIRDL